MDERKHRESHWLTQTRMNADHALHWIDPTHPWHRTGCILPQHNTHWHEKLEWCRGRATGFDEMQLQLLIKELLISIASSSKPSGKETTKNVSQHMPLQSRLLSSFNQCFQFPVLIFDLSLHTLDEWVKLSASAIRCTIEPCGKGFVFVTWQWNTGATHHGHATAFYFDGDRQYFFDPSGCLQHVLDINQQEVHKYFKHHHMWISLSHCDWSQLYVVDADLDIHQGMPDLQNMFSPLHGQPDPLDLRGSGCFIVIKTKIYFTQCLIAHLCCVTP